jgi:Cupin-like domain
MSNELSIRMRSTSVADMGSDKFSLVYRNKCPVMLLDVLKGWRATDAVRSDVVSLLATFFDDERERELPVFTAHDGRQFIKGYGTSSTLANVYDTCAHIFGDDLFPNNKNKNSLNKTEMNDDERLYLRASIERGVYASADMRLLAVQLFGAIGMRAPSDRFAAANQLVWVSSAGSVTPLHFDRCHGLLCQLVGSKRVVLIDPCETSSLYQRSGVGNGGPAHTSRVDMFAYLARDEAQLLRFPKMRNVPCYDFVLAPGESIYIPVGWWHAVETLEPSVSVSFAFDPSFDEPLPACMIR